LAHIVQGWITMSRSPFSSPSMLVSKPSHYSSTLINLSALAAEVPSNIMLKRTSPNFWFSLIMVLWAISTTVMGFVKTYPQLLIVRAILGWFEGGL
jgi:hypothetical protein